MGKGAKQLYSTTDLARQFKAHQNSIKTWVDDWEKRNLIAPIGRTPGGHRRFTQEHITQIAALLNQPTVPVSAHRGTEATNGD